MHTESLQGLGLLLGQGRTADVYAWGDAHVLKLYHTGWPITTVEQEARTSRQLGQMGLSVPAVGDVLTIQGRNGIVFQRVSGSTLIQYFTSHPWTVLQLVREFTDLHLQMHAQIMPDLPSQRQMLQRLIAEADVPAMIRQKALRRLDNLPDGRVVCHGDYHPENVLMTHAGPVIIDWVTATSGHPLADVARTSLLLEAGQLPHASMSRWLLTSARTVVHTAYLRRYLRRSRTRPEDLAAWRVPTIVARLGEGIAEERDHLLGLLAQA